MKNQTPMNMLKKELDQLKSSPLLSFFALNGRPRKVQFLGCEDWGFEMLVAGGITFDYIGVFGLIGDVFRNEKGHTRYAQSIGICINYKEEQTVRASVVLNQRGDAEYSKSFTVPEFRSLLKNFVSTYSDCTDRKALLDGFISTFGIVTSASLTKAELNKIKESCVQTVVKLHGIMERDRLAQHDARRAIREASSEFEKSLQVQRLNDLIETANQATLDVTHIVKHEFKDMPVVARNHFFDDLRNKKIHF